MGTNYVLQNSLKNVETYGTKNLIITITQHKKIFVYNALILKNNLIFHFDKNLKYNQQNQSYNSINHGYSLSHSIP